MTKKHPKNLDFETELTHDAFFRLSMGNLRIATDWFRAYLPTMLSKQANWRTLKIEPDSFVGHIRTI